ncbi:MAG TPA: Uma2 family endonuclease [Thermoanaerobaculia bacterium]|nr:Uma2 family endonuclease [Thermoanaerobaculia bacterium]
MTEPVRKTLFHEPEETDDGPDAPVVQRWRERPDGGMELLEFPLTPELFLDPRIGDKMVQGGPHSLAVHDLFTRLLRWASRHSDVRVQSDVKYLLGPGLAKPVPDISVVRGLANPRRSFTSYNVRKERIPPCLLLEVVSPGSARIRNVDEQDKVVHYQKAGILEYLLLDLPRPGNQHRHGFHGYRLDPTGRYRPIEPDAEGLLPSETTRLRFGVSPDGQSLLVFDDEVRETLLSELEESEARRRAEKEARREAQARMEAEQEIAHLRAEIDRLRGGS